jgi:hypothetical protein
VLLGLLLSAGMAQAGSLGISFSDLTAQVALDQAVREDAWGRSVVGVRGLYNDRKDTKLASGGLNVLGTITGTGLELGAGVRAYYVDSDADDIASGGLGALIRFVPPGFSYASLSGSLFYCPKVFTGLDGERLLDAEVMASFEIVPKASIFLSYTTIKAKIEDRGNRTLDDTLRGGLSLSF